MTFLFTDIEGSTRLLDELGPERYAAAPAEHRLARPARMAASRSTPGGGGARVFGEWEEKRAWFAARLARVSPRDVESGRLLALDDALLSIDSAA